MRADTQTITIDASPSKVFRFVSNPENLPHWARAFCQAIRPDGDAWLVSSPQREVRGRYRTDEALGVIDFHLSPAPGLEGLEASRVLLNVAGTPDRIAKAKRLITSSACGPSRCAPRTRSALSSMTTLNIAQVSATRRLEYQSEVSRILTRTSTCCSRASDSVRPTPASGGTVNTMLGIPR